MGEQLRQVILTFLTEQGRALPLLEVKQTLEREWVFTKKDYQYKWKRFLESMPLLSIETRVQPNGYPLDYVKANKENVHGCVQDQLPKKVLFNLHPQRRPKTLNEIVQTLPSNQVLLIKLPKEGTSKTDCELTSASTSIDSGDQEDGLEEYVTVIEKQKKSCFERIIAAFRRGSN